MRKIKSSGSAPLRVLNASFMVVCSSLSLFAGPASALKIYADNTVAHQGTCISPSDDDAKTILRRNGITLGGSYSPTEENALAKGIAQVERINGGPIPAAWHTQFRFLQASGPWNQSPGTINVRRLSYGGDNVAAMMHEFGHKIANANGQRILTRYLRSTSPCGITPYARFKRSEEFAEVFSAFIVNPDDLRNTCPTAYQTLKGIFNDGEKTSMASCANTKILLAERASRAKAAGAKGGTAVAATPDVSR